eukprot:773802-Amphidinium_carterae.1
MQWIATEVPTHAVQALVQTLNPDGVSWTPKDLAAFQGGAGGTHPHFELSARGLAAHVCCSEAERRDPPVWQWRGGP